MAEHAERPLAGKTALVTGASRNIGRAIALGLAADGAAVAVNGLSDQGAAEATVESIHETGGEAIACLGDIADAGAAAAMAARAEEAFGGVDILVLNASIRGRTPFLEMSHADFRRTVDTSLDGAFFLAQACLPHMVAKASGRIVTIGGISWHVGMPKRIHNLVAKSGLTGFTRGLAMEFAGHGITANMVAPGYIDTLRPASAGPGTVPAQPPPVGRLGHTHDIASMVGHLCRPEAAYITGQVLHVNGGAFLGGA